MARRAHPAREGVEHLRRVDPRMRALIDRVGAFGMTKPRHDDHFGSLSRAIVYQQLSGKAAGTIHGRYLSLFPEAPTPRAVLDAEVERMRSAGLSGAKVAALRDLAAAATDGRLPLPVPTRLTDEEIVERLVTVRGIGPWTAQMFLMFHLGRPDVLPLGDRGFRTGAKRLYGLRGEPSPARLLRLAEPWRPWRSVAVWYLWRSLDPANPGTTSA